MYVIFGTPDNVQLTEELSSCVNESALSASDHNYPPVESCGCCNSIVKK